MANNDEMKDLDLFKEIVPSLLNKREKAFQESSYNAYIINKTLSYYVDTVIYANMMNINYFLDKDMQYDYLFHSIRKYRRKFEPWIKNTINSPLEIVKEFFNYSNDKAKEVLHLFTESDLSQMKTQIDKGGVIKK